ncbi:MAG: hypothetical protein H6738_07325 [Alphaproteobacteria bacterium]|nr:hypothetical protein [Alphaproteobacteria bacterium]MCB9696574.1 hypothetical protein [Alphaproteobacteria bacterium]
MGSADRLASTLLDGVAALREGRHAEAVARLRAVCDDRELMAAPDLADVRARALSLLAQALLHAGELREAEGRADAALRLVRTVGDTEGIVEITDLLTEIRERATKSQGADASMRERMLSASLEDLSKTRDPGMRAEALLQKATAELGAGNTANALLAARAAWETAGAIGRDRVVVLARLCAAHADPTTAEEHLGEAWAVADASPEAEQLLGPVARAAELLRLALPEAARLHVGGRP